MAKIASVAIPISLPRHILDQLDAIRTQVRDIIPGGRNPERSYMAKDEALRGIERLMGQ